MHELTQACLSRLLHDHPNWSVSELLAQLSLSPTLEREKAALEAGFRLATEECGYGTLPFGKAPYGGTRHRSNGVNAVPRRITVLGQFSYRGFQYSVGKRYREQIVFIIDEGVYLRLTIPKQLSRRVLSRHFDKA